MYKKLLKLLKKIYRKLTRPAVLRRKKVSGIKLPRLSGLKNKETVKVLNGNEEEIFKGLLDMRNEMFAGFKPEDKVLIKININTEDDYPASTAPDMLCKLIECLNSAGINNIEVGDCSAYTSLPSRRVFKKTPLYDAVKDKVRLRFFDEEKWYKVNIEGEYLKEITLPEAAFEADRVIYLSNLKTHRIADFSFGMKLAVGLMHPKERIELHKENIHEKIAEIMLAFEPDLVIIDARKCFVTGGPSCGQTAEGDSLIIGQALLETDLEGYRLLCRLKEENDCLAQFKEDPFEMKQFKHAVKIMKRK